MSFAYNLRQNYKSLMILDVAFTVVLTFLASITGSVDKLVNALNNQLSYGTVFLIVICVICVTVSLLILIFTALRCSCCSKYRCCKFLDKIFDCKK